MYTRKKKSLKKLPDVGNVLCDDSENGKSQNFGDVGGKNGGENFSLKENI